MDKQPKIKTFNEYTQPKSLEEILEMPLHEANMQLDMNEGLGDSILNFVVDQGIKAVKGIVKYSIAGAKLGGKGGQAAAKAIKKRYSKQARADRKRDKAQSKADRLTDLRRAKEDLFDARKTIAIEKERLEKISADEKALNKAKIEKAKKELNKLSKDIEKGIKKLRGVK